MTVATPTNPVGVIPGSYADQLFELLQQILGALQCRNQLATQAPLTVGLTVPLAGAGIQGVQLLPYDAMRLGAVIVNTDQVNPIYIGGTAQINIPGQGLQYAGQPLFPLQPIAWNLDDADRAAARYAIAGGSAPVIVAVTVIK
ncbi:MAG: hypothetical protein ACREN7_00210 [Candidatus Dormibacteria bacterium]